MPFRSRGDARVLYNRLYDVYGADYPIPATDVAKTAAIDAIDIHLACESLEERGYCLRAGSTLTLLEPYGKG